MTSAADAEPRRALRRRRWPVAPLVLAAGAVLAACATTSIETTGTQAAAPLCQVGDQRLSALVLWAPAWRVDQKDRAQREDAARQGIESFFAPSTCYAKVEVRRLPGTGDAGLPTDAALLSMARDASPRPDRLLVITVHELGPVVRLLGSAALVEGGTEVVLQLKAFGLPAGTPLADTRWHWRDGGALVVKGTGSLPQDMASALRQALGAGPAPR
ncbi:hypothetical protein [Ideonella sp. A 288]|uniref:hypothetical protein n=1 Tax=Ideonella sp. A 288 TaxID=1962181 RepID=UPI000B4AE94E|nr:hypothetical protein [Ideonella sp. A 288]